MINISPIGRSCSQAERDAFVVYDSEHGVRRNMVAAINKEFRDADLSVCIGTVRGGGGLSGGPRGGGEGTGQSCNLWRN